MKVVNSIERWVVQFPLGCQPSAYKVMIHVVEVQFVGRDKLCLQLKTPSAFMNYYGTDTSESAIARQAGQGYFATEEEAWVYIDRQYPHWKRNQPIMEALHSAIRWNGSVSGPGHLADELDVPILGDRDIYHLARGTYKATRKQLQTAKQYAGLPV